MSWLKVQTELDGDAVTAVEEMLLSIGATSIELADAGDQPLLEPAPGETPLWHRVTLTALFAPTTSKTEIHIALAGAVAPGSLPPIRFDVIENEDWVSKLRDELQPMQFGDKLWICPPGKACPDPSGVVITMEPGLAFGTGTHATTALCLEWLAARGAKGQTVIDYGCGSGILSIASLALGANAVIAVDIDPQAITATRNNAARNPSAERLTVLLPGALDAAQTCDILLANILSGTLIELGPTLRQHCHAGTAIALSGILAEQASDVTDALGQWVTFGATIGRDNWVLLTGIVT